MSFGGGDLVNTICIQDEDWVCLMSEEYKWDGESQELW